MPKVATRSAMPSWRNSSEIEPPSSVTRCSRLNALATWFACRSAREADSIRSPAIMAVARRSYGMFEASASSSQSRQGQVKLSPSDW